MSVTRKDSIEMEKPEWLTQMENVLEVLNEGIGFYLRTRGLWK